MKKLVTLLAAAGMVVAASAPANAVDVKVDYRQRISMDVQSENFKGANQEETKMRARLGLSFAASENLGGYIQFQTGKENFGSAAGTAGTAGQISVRQMYIDWTVPATDVKVRMGRQLMGFPTEALGHNSVMDAGWGGRDGVVVAAPVTDWLGLTAMWARTGCSGTDVDTNKTDDIFGVVADVKFDAFTASVYGAYANIDFTGSASSEGIGIAVDTTKAPFAATDTPAAQKHPYEGITNVLQQYAKKGEGSAYWAGATFNLKAFDPFTFALSFAYGAAEFDGSHAKGEQEGWNVQAKASYKLGFGTPVLGAWYASGADFEDTEKGELGIMPSLGGYIAPTKSYHDNASSLNGGQAYYLPAGNWGVQVGIEDVSFLQDLTHTFLVTYMEGTNDKGFVAWADKYAASPSAFLSEEDSLVSFDLVNTYKIYKNLAAHLELAYIINDFEDARGMDEDAWRTAITFDFKF